MNRRFTLYILLLVLLCLLTGSAWTLVAYGIPVPGTDLPAWPWCLLPTLCLPYLGWKLYQLQRKQSRKVLFLLDAVENNDYAVHFAEHEGDADTRLVNHALNRIAHILWQVKNETAQQEKYYELILECINTGIVVLNDQGSVYQKNTEALRLLGLEVFTHLLQLNRIDPKLTERLQACRAGETFQMPLCNERGTRDLFVRVSDISVRGEHLRILALDDINHELDEREIDSWIRLTRVLTHEIMNAVTPITSLSDTLLELNAHSVSTDEVQSGLKTISATGKGLLAFVESYRKFTHIPTPVPSLFYLRDFIPRMVELARHQYPKARIAFRTRIEPDDLILHADEGLMAQVFTNLLKNAIQAITSQPEHTEEGHIDITARCDEQEAVIVEIRNDGPAIPPEVARHIFIPFFTTKDDGSGIGLSISRQIMRLSGGSLSLLPGRETTFVLRFD